MVVGGSAVVTRSLFAGACAGVLVGMLAGVRGVWLHVVWAYGHMGVWRMAKLHDMAYAIVYGMVHGIGVWHGVWYCAW